MATGHRGSGDDMLVSIQQTADGGYVLGGSSDSNISGDKTENSYGLSDYWIVKIDDTGNVQWQQTIGGGGYDVFDPCNLQLTGLCHRWIFRFKYFWQ